MKEENWELLSKYLAGECNQQEQQRVYHWLQASEHNRKYFDELQQIWQAADKEPNLEVPDLEMAWRNVDRATTRRTSIPAYKFYRRLAASFLLVTVIGILVYFSAYHNPLLTITTLPQEKKEVKLADGSHIWLNENSSLQYPEKFSGNLREVTLRGEAFFEIARNEARPFQISSGNSITQVLGTSFNIRETQANGIEIQVLTGRVSFYNKEAEGQHVLLQAGEMAHLAASAIRPVKEVNTDSNFLSWHTGVLTFKNAPLEEVIARLEEYYHKKVILENRQLADCALTSSFNNRSIEEVLQTLQTIYGLTYQIKADTLYLSGGGC